MLLLLKQIVMVNEMCFMFIGLDNASEWKSNSRLPIYIFKGTVHLLSSSNDMMSQSAKMTCAFHLLDALEKTSKLNTFRVRKLQYLLHFYFKDTVVNWAFSSLHGGSLIFTVPLMVSTVIQKFRYYYAYILAIKLRRPLIFQIYRLHVRAMVMGLETLSLLQRLNSFK